jgi:Rieske Fe-S protein
VLLKGVLIRTAAGDDRPERFSAFCLTCPHEQCEVKFVTDPLRLTELKERLTALAPAGGGAHPLFFCGCHLSVFDPAADGVNLAGPVDRGLYRFRVGIINDGAVEIAEVEEEALV